MRSDRRRAELYLELREIIQEMNEYVDAVIVEGSHDKRTMELMGFRNDIVKHSECKLNDGEFAEMIADRYKCVAILTDYDRAGEEKNRKLCSELERRGVRVEKMFRRKIGEKLRETGIRTIESIWCLAQHY